MQNFRALLEELYHAESKCVSHAFAYATFDLFGRTARATMNYLGFGIDTLKSVNQKLVWFTRSREQAVV